MAQYEESELQQPQQRFQTVNPYINDFSQGHSDLVKLALNSNDLMEELRMNLLALEWNPNKKIFEKSGKMSASIKETGAQRIITVVSSIVNRNAHLSNVKDEDIRQICMEIELNLNEDFFNNWSEYWDNEWEAESNWNIVRSMAGNWAKLALLRAKDGKEMNILGGGTKTYINKSEMESSQRITEIPQKKFGFFK